MLITLTPKQLAFVRAYKSHGKGREAAIIAGFSPHTAPQIASRMLAMPKIQAAIADARDKLEAEKPPVPVLRIDPEGDKPEVYIDPSKVGSRPDYAGPSPLEYLLSVMNNGAEHPKERRLAATAAATYMHTKKGEGGKKEEKEAAATEASRGKFAPTATPPKLRAVH
jgi:phage terminase small subunit